MDSSSSIAIVALSVTTATTVVLFFVQALLQSRQARRGARASMVAEVIGTMERTARPFTRPALLRPWTRPEIEFVLAIPRLMLNLERADAVVGQWAMTQTQVMSAAVSDREAMQIGIMVAVRLTEWHQGERDRDWFAGEVRANPLVPESEVPSSVALRRSLSRAKEYFLETLTIGLTILPSVAALAWGIYSPTGSSRRR